MLGEPHTRAQAPAYFNAYHHAIICCAHTSISIPRYGWRRLPSSANCPNCQHLGQTFCFAPRFNEAQRERIFPKLFNDVLQLALCAKQHRVDLTIDAEECERLELTLDIFMALAKEHVYWLERTGVGCTGLPKTRAGGN